MLIFFDNVHEKKNPQEVKTDEILNACARYL